MACIESQREFWSQGGQRSSMEIQFPKKHCKEGNLSKKYYLFPNLQAITHDLPSGLPLAQAAL